MDWQETIKNLWIERLVWIRQLIISIQMGLRDVRFVAERIQRNNAEFGRILGNVYGLEAGKQFEDLLTRYTLVLSDVVSTTKSGQNIDLLLEQWDKVAEDIAGFLYQLNPNYWPKETVLALIRDQIRLEMEFAQQLYKEQFAQGIAIFDPAYDNAMQAGQLMAYGIRMQFGL